MSDPQLPPGIGIELIGPYEEWMLDKGKIYDLPHLYLDNSSYNSNIAEVQFGDRQPAAIISEFKLIFEGENRNQFWVPPLWDDRKNYKLSFFPVMTSGVAKPLEGGDKTSTSSSFRNFSAESYSKFLALLNNEVQTNADSKFIKPININFLRTKKIDDSVFNNFLYRINFPLLKSSVDLTPVWKEGAKLDERVEGLKAKSIKEKKRLPKLVITAVIDDGIPFAHRNFQYRKSDGTSTRTRIDFCWSQSAIARPKLPISTDGDAPEELSGRLLFGREFSGHEINKLIADNKGDEDAIYRDAGVLYQKDGPPMPLDQEITHGAHVLDTLSGNWTNENDEDVRTRIIAVDLPPTISWETSGFGKDFYVLSAMHYIFKRADDIADAYYDGIEMSERDPVSLVVNLSYGYSGGPHDGSSLIEAAIEEMVQQRRSRIVNNQASPTAIVMASGNTFSDNLHAVIVQDHFSQMEVSGWLEASLQWRLLSDDRTSSFFEIWLPKGLTRYANDGTNNVEVSIASPTNNQELKLISKGNSKGFERKRIFVDGKEVGRLSYENYRMQRERFVIALAPTEPKRPANDTENLPGAPAGVWTIKIRIKDKVATDGATSKLPLSSIVIGDVDVHGVKKPDSAGGFQCFVQRDISFGVGNTGAQQSFIFDRENELYDEYGRANDTDSVSGLKLPNGKGNKAKVRRFGSLNGLATAKSTLVCGGIELHSAKASLYSSSGALRYDAEDSGRVKTLGKSVEMSAVTDRNQWNPGIVAAGTRSGLTNAQQGTSSASPQVARALAEAFLSAGDISETVHNNNYVELLKKDASSTIEPNDQHIAVSRSKARFEHVVYRKSRTNDKVEDEQIEASKKRVRLKQTDP